MKINEIFFSIQGEGKWTGKPNIFLRFTGCNLKCEYCDTKYAYYNGKEFSIDEITKKIKDYNCKKVCITGGEPLLQDNLNNLIDKLIDLNYEILIETNGSINIEKISQIDRILISLDIKCPSSKMHEKMNFENIKKLKKKDQIKFVIKDKKDYEYSKKIIEKYQPKCQIFFQPVWKSKPDKLAKWILEDGLNVTLGLQIHKIIWRDKKGV